MLFHFVEPPSDTLFCYLKMFQRVPTINLKWVILGFLEFSHIHIYPSILCKNDVVSCKYYISKCIYICCKSVDLICSKVNVTLSHYINYLNSSNGQINIKLKIILSQIFHWLDEVNIFCKLLHLQPQRCDNKRARRFYVFSSLVPWLKFCPN